MVIDRMVVRRGKNLLTKMKLLNPNSEICISGVMVVVLKIGVGRTASSGRCCSEGAPFTTASSQSCCWTLARVRSNSCAILHDVVLRPGGLLCHPCQEHGCGRRCTAAGAISSTATFPLEVAGEQMHVGAIGGRKVYASYGESSTCVLVSA